MHSFSFCSLLWGLQAPQLDEKAENNKTTDGPVSFVGSEGHSGVQQRPSLGWPGR